VASMQEGAFTNELRSGATTSFAIQSFRALSRSIVSNNTDILPTELSHMCHEFERTNSTRLTVLQTLPFDDARVSESASPNKRKAMLACVEVLRCLVLKK